MTKLVISPRINERGRLERESLVTPHKLEGGKRKGKSMKRPPKTRGATVTIDNLKTARDNGGVWNKTLNCVEYKREGT